MSSSYSAGFGGSGFESYGTYMQHKDQQVRKQLRDRVEQRTSNIFEGCKMQVDGRTNILDSELKMLFIENGGEYLYWDPKNLTHVVADNLAMGNKRLRDIRDRMIPRKIQYVTSDWILDSIREGRRLRETDYMPKILLEKVATERKALHDFLHHEHNNYEKPLSIVEANHKTLESKAKEERQGSLSSDSPTLDFYEADESARTVITNSDETCNGEAVAGLEVGLSSSEIDNEKEMSDTTSSSLASPARAFDPNPRSESVNTSPFFVNDNEGQEISPERKKIHLSNTDPHFVQNFFKSSRLHFIGRWRERIFARFQFQSFVQIRIPPREILTLKGFLDHSMTTKHNSLRWNPIRILHIDFDSFFVAVILKKATHIPKIDQLPVGVAHGSSQSLNSSSEIASCNYVARLKGVRKGTYIRDAKQICPDLIILPYDFDEIDKCSDCLMRVLSLITPRILPTSIDEAYIQLIGDFQVDSALFIAQWIHDRILTETQCSVSIGIGDTMLTAKFAGQMVKDAKMTQNPRNESADVHLIPMAQWELNGRNATLQEASAFIRKCIQQRIPASALRTIEIPDWIDRLEATRLTFRDVPITNLHGVGQRASRIFRDHGVETCADCQHLLTLKQLQTLFGNQQGLIFYEMALGIDRRQISTIEQCRGGLHGWADTEEVNPKKTLTVAVNWGVRLTSEADVANFLEQMAVETASRLRDKQIGAERFVLKVLVRHPEAPIDPSKYGGCGICNEYTKKFEAGPKALHSVQDFCKISEDLWIKHLRGTFEISDIRGVTFILTKFKSLKGPTQSTLESLRNFVQASQSDTYTTPEETSNAEDGDFTASLEDEEYQATPSTLGRRAPKHSKGHTTAIGKEVESSLGRETRRERRQKQEVIPSVSQSEVDLGHTKDLEQSSKSGVNANRRMEEPVSGLLPQLICKMKEKKVQLTTPVATQKLPSCVQHASCKDVLKQAASWRGSSAARKRLRAMKLSAAQPKLKTLISRQHGIVATPIVISDSGTDTSTSQMLHKRRRAVMPSIPTCADKMASGDVLVIEKESNLIILDVPSSSSLGTSPRNTHLSCPVLQSPKEPSFSPKSDNYNEKHILVCVPFSQSSQRDISEQECTNPAEGETIEEQKLKDLGNPSLPNRFIHTHTARDIETDDLCFWCICEALEQGWHSRTVPFREALKYLASTQHGQALQETVLTTFGDNLWILKQIQEELRRTIEPSNNRAAHSAAL